MFVSQKRMFNNFFGEIEMKKIVALAVFFAIFAISCGSTDEKGGDGSLLEKKIGLIKEQSKGKKITEMVDIFKLKPEYGTSIDSYIENIFDEVTKNAKNHPLDSFKESPNRDLQIAQSVTQIHLKNNYPSGNVILFLKKGNKTILKDYFEFNTEKKYEVEPGGYEFILIIDRKFNDNVYVFKSELNFKGGELYMGEFNIVSQYNKEGSCEQGFIMDEELCIIPSFKILDNCNPGSHLVEHLCCEEGFNFIMEGKCSRYSDTVETVICPAGYHEGGKGRCCPKGTMFIDDKCQEPSKETKEEPKE